MYYRISYTVEITTLVTCCELSYVLIPIVCSFVVVCIVMQVQVHIETRADTKKLFKKGK